MWVRDADRAPETSSLRPRKDEVDVRHAQRTEVLPLGRAKRLLEHADSPILEIEPPREPGAQLAGRLERPHLALLRLEEGKSEAARRTATTIERYTAEPTPTPQTTFTQLGGTA